VGPSRGEMPALVSYTFAYLRVPSHLNLLATPIGSPPLLPSTFGYQRRRRRRRRRRRSRPHTCSRTLAMHLLPFSIFRLSSVKYGRANVRGNARFNSGAIPSDVTPHFSLKNSQRVASKIPKRFWDHFNEKEKLMRDRSLPSRKSVETR